MNEVSDHWMCRLSWTKITSWGWWDKLDDTSPWHRIQNLSPGGLMSSTSRGGSHNTVFTRGQERNMFFLWNLSGGTNLQAPALQAGGITTTPGQQPIIPYKRIIVLLPLIWQYMAHISFCVFLRTYLVVDICFCIVAEHMVDIVSAFLADVSCGRPRVYLYTCTSNHARVRVRFPVSAV